MASDAPPPPSAATLARVENASLVAIGALAAAAAFGSGVAFGGELRGSLAVGAFVQPVAVLDPDGELGRLLVTPADIARGYVDVDSRLSVRTTSRFGYRVDVRARLALFRLLELTLPTGRTALGPEGGSIVARVAGSVRGTATPIRYRFHLVRDVQPGDYPWPLALSVRPLER